MHRTCVPPRTSAACAYLRARISFESRRRYCSREGWSDYYVERLGISGLVLTNEDHTTGSGIRDQGLGSNVGIRSCLVPSETNCNITTANKGR